MTRDKSPERWAIDLSLVLKHVFGDDRFPINVSLLAQEYTKQAFPAERITRVSEREFEGFEGALIPRPGTGEWGIGYSSSITSPGRRNFTIAHEFGHYLLHRKKYPDGLECKPEEMAVWDSEYNLVEAEANRFAASLLMPLDDFRSQIPAREWVDLEGIGGVADRYEVSLMAATLRWLSYTEKRAVLVVSRDGFILWARSSEPALRSGAYIRVADNVIPVPERAACTSNVGSIGMVPKVDHPSGVWFREPVVEHALISERHDLSLSLLLLENAGPRAETEEEPIEDLVDRSGKLRW
ncbi:ImmA/IrrE family metallo-endopeptidase [Thalassobaculum sp.]|uniref:ImmA/IrrE family metallo-endopeptidase n=1 Tax=Thalassobaculum sp. TaxID=2022740 RepID=UPI0032EDD29C